MLSANATDLDWVLATTGGEVFVFVCVDAIGAIETVAIAGEEAAMVSIVETAVGVLALIAAA
jgi:hypothetical protein